MKEITDDKPLKRDKKLFNKVTDYFGGITKTAIELKLSIQSVQYAKVRGYFSIYQALMIDAKSDSKFKAEDLVHQSERDAVIGLIRSRKGK